MIIEKMKLKAVRWNGQVLFILPDDYPTNYFLEAGYEIVELCLCPQCKGMGLIVKNEEKNEKESMIKKKD